MEESVENILSVKEQSAKTALSRPYKLIEIIQETPTVKTFKFKSEFGEKMIFKPGQFVQIGYSSDGSKIDVQRFYSIGSVPGADTMEFYIEMIGGKLTSVLDKAKIGDLYNIGLPNGKNFEYVPGYSKKSLFIAASTGIAPFMSMLRYIEQNHIQEDIVVLYTVRTKADIIRASALEEFNKNGVAKIAITLTREGNNSEWKGETGHLDKEKIFSLVPDVKERVAYLCGSNKFNSAMTEILISLGVKNDKEHIKHDVWGGH